VVVFRQPGANIIATVDRVIAALPFLKASLPQAIDMVVGLDRTTTVRASVADVQRTLLISVVLVVLVVFIFLREVRATLIPAWLCRWPLWAPSASCTCSAIRWTTCR